MDYRNDWIDMEINVKQSNVPSLVSYYLFDNVKYRRQVLVQRKAPFLYLERRQVVIQNIKQSKTGKII